MKHVITANDLRWSAVHSYDRPAYLVVCWKSFVDGRSVIAKTWVPYEEVADERLSFRTLRWLLRCQKYVSSRTINSPDEELAR
jgi:hypothetical protein